MSSSTHLTSKDLSARSKALEVLRSKFNEVIEEVMNGRTPTLVIRKRTLTNTIYDEVNGLLKLGEGVLKRSFLNVNESKKFMQTLLMASIIYESLKNNEYPTIRDLYYRGKHTIKYRDLVTRKIKEENTWDEQKESDSVIRDLEVFIDMLREDMLILSKEKGKVVGNMRIRSGDDVIDLSKMGHGAYSIEPTPDLIEFLDYDVEYVLVIEKDAVFQQLHRIGYWKTNKALLVTSAGQPDRATRRFVKRLNEELKLPVYILTDSIPADEVVIVRDLVGGEVKIGSVEELTKDYFSSNLERERTEAPLEVLSWNPVTGKINWSPIGYIYRHKIKEPILKIVTSGRGVIRVTKAHSIFVFRDWKIEAIPAKDIRPGDYIVAAKHLPLPVREDKPLILLAELLKKATQKNSIKLHKAFKLIIDGREIALREASDEELRKAEFLKLPKLGFVPNKIELDEDLAWVMGVCTAETNKHLTFRFSSRESEKAEKISEVLKKKFGIQAKTDVNTLKKRVELAVNSRILRAVFEELGLLGTTKEKHVPNIIINSPRNIILAYLKGLIDGGGYIDEHGDIVYSTENPVLARQVFLLLQFLGVTPTLTQDKTNYVITINRDSCWALPDVRKYLFGVELSSHESLNKQVYKLPVSKTLKKLTELLDGGLATYSYESSYTQEVKAAKLFNKNLTAIPEDHQALQESDAVLVRVESVEEEMYEGYVYDFAVPGDNSFVGGFGIVYHNSDPYGFYIYSVFRVGSITLSYESERLATPKARFLGVMMSDVYGSPKLGKKPYLSESERKNYIIKAKEMDIKRAKELMNYKWFQTPRWKVEIDIFLEKLSKLEIEALTSKGLKFLADTYIPNKIEVGDWLA